MPLTLVDNTDLELVAVPEVLDLAVTAESGGVYFGPRFWGPRYYGIQYWGRGLGLMASTVFVRFLRRRRR